MSLSEASAMSAMDAICDEDAFSPSSPWPSALKSQQITHRSVCLSRSQSLLSHAECYRAE